MPKHEKAGSLRRGVFAVLLLGTACLGRDAYATCTATVGVSKSGTVLTMTATSSGTCGVSGVQVGIDDSIFIGRKDCPESTCTGQFVWSTACANLGEGGHTVKVTATCGKTDPVHDCVEDDAGTGQASFTLVTEPEITITSTEPGEDGLLHWSASYNYPNAELGSPRLLSISYAVEGRDGEGALFYGTPPAVQGTVEGTLPAQCLPGKYIFRGLVQYCSGSREDHRATTEQTAQINPKMSVGPITIDRETLDGNVHYSFPAAGSGRRLELHRASTDALLAIKNDITTDNLVGDWPIHVTCATDADPTVYVSLYCDGVERQRTYAQVPTCERSCKLPPDCPTCFGAPVHVSSGSMEYVDTDVLPGMVGGAFVRTYHSSSTANGVFGRGWSTLFDARAISSGGSDGREGVYVQLEDGRNYAFQRIGHTAQSVGNTYVQIYPAGDAAPGTLMYDGSTAVFRYRTGGDLLTREFSLVTGRLVSIGYPGGDAMTISYSGGRPVSVADSRGRWSWTLTYGPAGFVEAIDVAGHPELAWHYEYTSGQLTAVKAPSSSPWRAYTYGISGMLAAYDAAGHEIESHAYDATGRAITSSTNGEEITDVQYQLGRVAGERKTSVTTADGKTTAYYTRYIAGAVRTVEVAGSCSCGTEDAVFVHAANGYVLREQNARGYVTTRLFTGAGRLRATTTYLKPAGCDPETDAARCRLSPDALATAALDVTPQSVTAEFAYEDPKWPDRVTRQTTDSVRTGQVRAESYTYDPVTGAVTSRTVSGYDPTATQTVAIVHTTTTALYDGVAAAVFDPCAGTSGPCAFAASWVTLAQPARYARSTDGPRTDVDDSTAYVYYPFDATVPAEWRGRVAAVKNAAGHVTRFEDYDIFGNAHTTVDPNGVRTETTYDGLGRQLTSTIKGVTGCNAAVDPLCATDITHRRMYNPVAGPLAIEIGPSGEAVAYVTDGRGRTTETLRGRIEGAVPNTAAAAIAAATWSEKISYEYSVTTGRKDAERIWAMEGGAWVEKKSTGFQYDVSGHLAAMTYADGHAIRYTYENGLLRTVRDENHADTTVYPDPNTRYAYDPAGRLTSVTQTLAGAPGNQIVTRYVDDRIGNLTSVEDPNGNVTTYAYDDFGQMVKQVSPVTGTTVYGYDASGNLVTTTDANGATTTRTYDALGRVTGSVATRGGVSETLSWTYDGAAAFAKGRLAQTVDPTGTTAYTYERRGLLAQESITDSGNASISAYEYDRSGNLAVIRYPFSNVSVAYTYDFAGRQASASSSHAIVTSASYLPFGPLKELAFGNGTVQKLVYDARYRMTANELWDGAVLIAGYAYQYDASGNVTSIGDLVEPEYGRTFGYDDLHRLVVANTGPALWGTGSYQYDRMGNILSVRIGDPAANATAEEAYFTYEGTTPKVKTVRKTSLVDPGEFLIGRRGQIQPLGVGYQTVTYDAAGNEVRYVASRTYSPRNLLGSVADASEVAGEVHRIEYGYDARGVRTVRKETPGIAPNDESVQRSYYTPDLRLIDRTPLPARFFHPPTSDPGSQRNAVVWFAGRPVAQLANPDPAPSPDPVWTFADHLGTPILQTRSDRTVFWRAEYEPFGNLYLLRAGERFDQPLRFPGQEVAITWEGTEENYNIFRWYRSGWGRYSSADPIGLQGGLNLYRYANANPINAVDPTGLAVRVICRRVDVGRGFLPWLVGAWLQPVHCRLQVECPCSDGQGDPRAPFNRTIGMEATGGGYQLNTDQFLAPRWGGRFQDYERGWFNVPVTPPGGSGGCDFERCLLREARARENTSPQTFMRPYAIAGPNSNSYIRNLVDTCGGSAQWPQNAYGADPNPFWGGNYRP